MASGLPRQYVFYLICCYKEGCKHELCQAGKASDLIKDSVLDNVSKYII